MKKLAFLAAAATFLACSKKAEEPSTPAGNAPTEAARGGSLPLAEPASQAKPAKSAAELEKEKALANPYPNDLGPAKIDEQVADYPADKKEGYRLLLTKCAQCHSSARPLNSRFVEADDTKLSEPGIWQVEPKIWNRYVKRMMAKPGCAISADEGKKIWQFLVYDGARRKLGANAAAWKAHRQKLLSEFKAKHPSRYEELARDKDL